VQKLKDCSDKFMAKQTEQEQSIERVRTGGQDRLAAEVQKLKDCSDKIMAKQTEQEQAIEALRTDTQDQLAAEVPERSGRTSDKRSCQKLWN
jgi:hypothetical protein